MTAGRHFGDPHPPEYYDRPAVDVARDLLGDVLVSTLEGERTAGRIVEAEAYIGPHDAASHAAERIGRTPRNASMFGPPGIAYVYRIYGVHWCLNVVTGPERFPAAILIRAIEPLAGLEVMRRRRPGRSDRELVSGPGRVAAALAITGAQDGHPLHLEPLLIVPGEKVAPERVRSGPRIGLTRAADLPLRFWEADSVWVSRR